MAQGESLYRIDDLLLRAGKLTLFAVVAVACGIAGIDFLHAASESRNLELSRLRSHAPLLLLAGLCPVALLVAGARLRKQEQRISAIWKILQQNAEISVRVLLANSDFEPAELERAVRFLNNRGLGYYVWDRKAETIQDARLASMQLHVEKCEVCSATVSLRVPVSFQEVPRCPYCDDPVSIGDLQEQRREALEALRDEHREEKQGVRSAATSASSPLALAPATTATTPLARPTSSFSVPLFVILLIVFWPAGVGYALYQWQRG